MSDEKKPIPGSPARQTPARTRTLEHLHKLLTTAAVTGATLGPSACDDPLVCDPMPAPISCNRDYDTSELWEWASWQGSWREEGGRFVVDLEITISATAQGRLSFSAAPTVEGGALDDFARDAQRLRMTVTPDAKSETVTVTAPTDCQGRADAIVLALDVSGEPRDGDSVPIAPGD